MAAQAIFEANEETGDEFMIFIDGQINNGIPGTTRLPRNQVLNHMGILIPKLNPSEPRLKAAGMDLSQLWVSKNKTEQAELQWRISIR